MKKFVAIILTFMFGILFYGCSESSEGTVEVSEYNINFSEDIIDFLENREIVNKLIKSIENDNYTNLIPLEKDGLFNSEYKKTINEPDAYYYGEMKDNRPDGEGIFIEGDVNEMSEITILIGEFKDGVADGYGLLISRTSSQYDAYVDKNQTYQGLSIYNLLKDSNTRSYEGDFKDFEPDGKGNLYFMGGIQINDKYEIVINNELLLYSGEIDKNEYNGEGTLFSIYGGILYKGEFDNGLYDGDGILYYENIDDSIIKYTGEFKNGEYHGKGELYDENGNLIEEGEFDYGDLK